MRDIDPEGRLSLTEHDIAVARELAVCPACLAKRPHTDEEWRLHPGEGRQGVNDPPMPRETQARPEVEHG
jgi:hypothetical protein